MSREGGNERAVHVVTIRCNRFKCQRLDVAVDRKVSGESYSERIPR